jgi:L-asparaginase
MTDLCILATGGTIDKEHDPIAEQLVFTGRSHVPDMLVEFRAGEIPHDILMLKDSLGMTDEDRETILRAVLSRPEKSIVITHGTDTMEITAEYLAGKTGDKTIALTGCLRPFSLFRSDAGFNLGGAIVAARTMPAGVYVVMNGRVFRAGEVSKNKKTGFFAEKK